MTGKGWTEAPDNTGKAPKHKVASRKNKLKSTSRRPFKTESPEQIAARHIKKSPNTDWHRKYKIRSVKNISFEEGGKIFNGRYILLEFLEPLNRPDYKGNFVGAYIVNIPEIYMDEAFPVLFYKDDKDTWERREENYFYSAKLKARIHVQDKKCKRCGSYKPPHLKEKQGGRELIYITSTCPDCLHQEVEPYD